jgi:hypothetical protein
MRQMISGMVAAVAVMTAGAAPAMACGFAPCALPVAPVYSGCNTGCGWGYERLVEPTTQYYYVNQGPTYTGPGAFAPYPTNQEDAVVAYGARQPYGYDTYYRPYRYGYGPRYGYLPRVSYGARYGYAPYYYHGRRVLRRYY